MGTGQEREWTRGDPKTEEVRYSDENCRTVLELTEESPIEETR